MPRAPAAGWLATGLCGVVLATGCTEQRDVPTGRQPNGGPPAAASPATPGTEDASQAQDAPRAPATAPAEWAAERGVETGQPDEAATRGRASGEVNTGTAPR